MMTRSGWQITLGLLLSAMVSYAEPDNPGLSPTLSIELRDGSRLIGTPAAPVIPMTSAMGKIDVPLATIATITFADERAGITVTMTNQDRLSGTHTIKEWQLKTLFGDVIIDPVLLKKITCLRSPAHATIPKGLILWNRLESEDDVKESRVGPGGRYNAGRFRDGKFGKGVELNLQESFGVTFPLEVLPLDKGCLEFWAKLEDFPNIQSDRSMPALIGIDEGPGTRGALLHFNANDGAANGGLCMGMFGAAGTGPHGSWTYTRALGMETISDWHHFAVVWDASGIAGIGNGKRLIAVFVDGVLNTKSWTEPPGIFPARPMKGYIGLFWHQGLPSGRVVYDNLKIWNYSKIDFSDRNEE